MKATLGYGASTCSYADWLDADLIVFFGSNVAEQPAGHDEVPAPRQAERRRRSPSSIRYREPGLERYWIPSVAASALFGTALADHWFDVHTGGDLAFLVGVLQRARSRCGGDRRGVRPRAHDRLRRGARRGARRPTGTRIERESGATADAIERVRPAADRAAERGLRLVDGADAARARRRHDQGADQRRPRRAACPAGPNRGLVPIRGHSGVQGGAEVGCAPSVDAATRGALGERVGLRRPDGRGWTTARDGRARRARRRRRVLDRRRQFSRDAAGRGRSRARAAPAAAAHPSGHRALLVDAGRRRRRRAAAAGDDALRVAGRRHRDLDRAAHHLLAGDSRAPHRIGAAGVAGVRRSRWRARSRPRRPSVGFESAAAIRREIARRRAALRRHRAARDARAIRCSGVGRTLYADGRFATPDGKAHLRDRGRRCVRPRRPARSDVPRLDAARQAVQLDGAARHRSADRRRARRRADQRGGCRSAGARVDGDPIALVSPYGRFEGRAHVAPILPGNLEVHWPEAMGLLAPDWSIPSRASLTTTSLFAWHVVGSGLESAQFARRGPRGAHARVTSCKLRGFKT